ncbi:hypothetical protein, partial [Mesorhizobium sp. M1E.F.Ca.ET.063.01.1.1]|uniref:hypothetical protein n=1 Tax=Mesorhizobium sp. M1E.F.Ca.ET.063.01.1.1 TaxID=2496750 RepID=UPI001AECEBD3
MGLPISIRSSIVRFAVRRKQRRLTITGKRWRPEGNLPAKYAICPNFAQTDGGAMYRLWASMTHPMRRMTRIYIRVRHGI